jgi:hypothetical protein
VLECSCYLRIFLFITCYRVSCSLFCFGILVLFTYIPLYYMLQGTMHLILCWNVDVIYVYSSLLHVTGYRAAYCVGMLMLFTYIPLYYMLQDTMQLILCWNVDVIYVYLSLYYMLQGIMQLILCWNVDVIYVCKLHKSNDAMDTIWH